VRFHQQADVTRYAMIEFLEGRLRKTRRFVCAGLGTLAIAVPAVW
jgi:hypothetical protein